MESAQRRNFTITLTSEIVLNEATIPKQKFEIKLRRVLAQHPEPFDGPRG